MKVLEATGIRNRERIGYELPRRVGLHRFGASSRAIAPLDKQHVLSETIVPAPIEARLAAEADRIARHVAEELDVVGLLAVEMFVTRDGQVLVNELAPRPHNSGHWTLDACVTSQFEQCVRAVCGLPLGATDRLSDAVMTNLLGADADAWADILSDPANKLHLYGKAEARPGRKMGHVTRRTRRRDVDNSE